MSHVEQLLLDLVAIPSVSAMNNRAVIDYVVACLDPNTWETHLDSYVDSAGTPKTNLIALTKNASSHARGTRSRVPFGHRAFRSELGRGRSPSHP